MRTDHFNFFIAHNELHIATLRKRIRLIKKYDLYDIDSLVSIIRNPTENKNLVLALTKYAKSNAIQLDEYERALLIYCRIIHENLSIEKVAKYSNFLIHCRSLDKRRDDADFALAHSKLIKRELDKMVDYKNIIIKLDFPKMRAKVALIEIAAAMNPDVFVPNLIAYSVKYLSCNFVQNWIRNTKYRLYKDPQNRNLNLIKNEFGKSIWGNRNLKPRLYDYWRIYSNYAKIQAAISRIRLGDIEIGKDEFKNLCKLNNIPRSYQNLILDKKVSIKQLALDIMAENKTLKDPKSFKEFQSFIAQLQKKHFNASMGGIENEVIPELIPFLDLPGKMPQEFSLYSLFDQLQRIEIS